MLNKPVPFKGSEKCQRKEATSKVEQISQSGFRGAVI